MQNNTKFRKEYVNGMTARIQLKKFITDMHIIHSALLKDNEIVAKKYTQNSKIEKRANFMRTFYNISM